MRELEKEKNGDLDQTGERMRKRKRRAREWEEKRQVEIQGYDDVCQGMCNRKLPFCFRPATTPFTECGKERGREREMAAQEESRGGETRIVSLH